MTASDRPGCFGDGSVLLPAHYAEACCDTCAYTSKCIKTFYKKIEKPVPIKAIISAKVALEFYIADHCTNDCVELMVELEELEAWLKKQKRKKQ